ncbi:MAG: zinc ribbon domain-containing protein [Tissierellia bacterium]|nr:zinc ribbon domain-containing protein [Tissierellia bacterium]
MFFIAGVSPKRKKLDYYEPIMCNCCSKYGRYEGYMEYSVLSLFFIPLFKFNKKFYARTTCCNSLYLITNKEKGLMMERGQGHKVFLKEKDLKLIQKGISCSNICPSCGHYSKEEYKYCPNCGNKL